MISSMVFAKILGFSIVAIMISGLTAYPAFAVSPVEGDFFYTTSVGTPNVHKVHYKFDGSTFTLGTPIDIASTPKADGLIFAPDGDLLVGGHSTGNVFKVNPSTGTFVTKASGVGFCAHLSLDPSLTSVWCGQDNIFVPPNGVGKIPLSPFADGTAHAVTGDDGGVDSLAFVGSTAFYTSSGPGGFPSAFGTIDLSTFVTHRDQGIIAGAHGMIVDPSTNDLILCGANEILQIDPTNPTSTVSTFTLGGVQFDQCAADGHGHLFVADNFGTLLFMDYSASGKVGDTGNFVANPFLAVNLDDIAPITGLGGPTTPPTSGPVGGEIIPVDMTSLFVAGVMTNTSWMLPTLGGIGGAVLALFKVKRWKQS